ncbi:MAG: LysR family transcriptional regulator [Chromatiales bacterium]|jgi:DNA-binding transcriptional LysR family regulator
MDIILLQAFIEVAYSGSFSGAARRLFVTQPAVSKRIAALEEELGTALFDRSSRRVRLTDAGRALEPLARRLVNEAADIKRLVANISARVEGTLVMGTSHHVGLHRLPRALKAYTRRFPGVRLDIRFMDSESACREVELGELELAIVTLPDHPRRLRAKDLWEDRLRFVVGPDHPLAGTASARLGELAAHPAVLPSPATYTRGILDRVVAEAGLALRVAMSTNYLETLKMLAATGLGWTLLPHTMLDGEVVEVSVQGLDLRRRLGAVTREGATLSNAAQAMIDTCSAGPAGRSGQAAPTPEAQRVP